MRRSTHHTREPPPAVSKEDTAIDLTMEVIVKEDMMREQLLTLFAILSRRQDDYAAHLAATTSILQTVQQVSARVEELVSSTAAAPAPNPD